jgi:hypothetical protein
MPTAAPRDKTGHVGFGDAKRAHERSHVIGKHFGGIRSFRYVALSGPSQVKRDAGEVLGVFCHLECVAGVVRAQVRDQDERLTTSLLVVVDRDVVGFDPGHGVPSNVDLWDGQGAPLWQEGGHPPKQNHSPHDRE